jgi:hypothetical protein
LSTLIKSETCDVAERIRGAWENGSTLQDYLATETLDSIYHISNCFNLDLDDWIADQTLRIGPALKRFPEVDTGSAATLAKVLNESDRSIANAEQGDACRRLFIGWCSGIADGDEWDDLVAFANWVTESDQTGLVTSLTAGPDLRDAFVGWLDSEIEAAFDNSDDQDMLDQWLDEAERRIVTVFGGVEFGAKMQTARERAYEKWNREPDPSEIEYAMRASRAGEVVERAAAIQLPTSPATTYRSESERIKTEITGLFKQLGQGG